MQLNRLRYLQGLALLSFLALPALGEAIRHSNGQIAYEHRSNYADVVYHSNGRIAWEHRSGYSPVVYHSNGRIAWEHRSGYFPIVTYGDGRTAWNGKTCYHQNGGILKENCKGVVVSIGEGLSLSVRDDGNGGALADLAVYGQSLTVKR